ncbi:hypothetical protein PA7_19670 [Pseudonocardia asaccharolytica DSM 44247 = NBRC 16224]|uniref:Nitroreductase domain-containing protein n=1 Tax=Pseudonocardia asaccharolytica DSM 44247 = NBRC 16224 TaxID=1123024 RepID=A0A511D005_9PSEU|nr:hypothetical protein PA7_19670 [Pseudonocardia asaccharolytica DSM 44247 = NBRC 16224]
MLTAALDRALTAVSTPMFTGAVRWWVSGTNGGIELRTAVSGNIPVSVQRPTRVAAGSALLAARLAIAVAGYRPFTTLLPDHRRPGILAVLRKGGAAEPNQSERALYGALVQPAVERAGRPIGVAATLPLLRRAADTEGAWLRSSLDPGDRTRMEALLDESGGAVPSGGLLVVVGSHHDLPTGDLRAGLAVQRVLLCAAALGLSAEVLAGPVELARRSHELPGAGPGLVPQVLLQVSSPIG